MSDQLLDGNVEKMAEALKDSDMIKIAQLDGDKDQSDTGTASSAGDETQSAGGPHDELPTASITVTVKGICSVIVDCYSLNEGLFS